jgi:multidrug transporter EmrE-like cation transporter
MWFRWMMVAFILNGACTFGLRILQGMGLAAGYTSQYLAFWYLSGMLFLLIVYLRGLRRPTRADVAVGVGLGVFSTCGQTAIGLALAKGMPGDVVYPVILAGGLFLVVACGLLFFREKVGKVGLVGILLGIISIALLSLN